MDIGGFVIPTVVAAVASAGAAFTAVYGTFSRFEEIQSQENRLFIGQWLLGLPVPKRGSEIFFIELFNKVFGRSHWSVRCAIASFVLSGFFLALAFLANYSGSWQTGSNYNPLAGVGWPISALGACLIDYVSLWKTRLVLTKVSTLHSALASLVFVLFDFILTTVLFSLLPFFLMFALVSSEYGLVGAITYNFFNLHNFLHEVVPTQTGIAVDSFKSPYYLVALFTSAWVWVYVLSAQTVRLFGYIPRFIVFLSKVTDVKEHPVRVLGFVAGIVSAFVVAIINVL